jgi:hypothetical protein
MEADRSGLIRLHPDRHRFTVRPGRHFAVQYQPERNTGMGSKLTKAEIEQKGAHAANLKSAWDEVVAAEDEVNEALARYNEQLNAYNETVVEVNEFKDGIVNALQEYFDEKSEKWQEGDAGQELEALKSEWEGIEIEEIDHLEIEFPNDPGAADELDGLPDA